MEKIEPKCIDCGEKAFLNYSFDEDINFDQGIYYLKSIGKIRPKYSNFCGRYKKCIKNEPVKFNDDNNYCLNCNFSIPDIVIYGSFEVYRKYCCKECRVIHYKIKNKENKENRKIQLEKDYQEKLKSNKYMRCECGRVLSKGLINNKKSYFKHIISNVHKEGLKNINENRNR